MTPARQGNVHHAQTALSELLLDVERGQEIVIARNGCAVAKLVPFPAATGKRLRVDTWQGRIQMAVDVDAPLTDAELRAACPRRTGAWRRWMRAQVGPRRTSHFTTIFPSRTHTSSPKVTVASVKKFQRT